MKQDILRGLGPLAFASRLKRLSESLQRDVSRLYRDLDMPFQARWFPVAYLLARKAPQAVTEVADRLGMTHPAVNQIAGQMIRAGLLESKKDKRDERRRLLKLTRTGQRTVKKLQPLWQAIKESTRELLDQTDRSFLENITVIEQALAARDMYRRTKERLDQ